jgi:hypothetical protein
MAYTIDTARAFLEREWGLGATPGLTVSQPDGRSPVRFRWGDWVVARLHRGELSLDDEGIARVIEFHLHPSTGT